MTRPTRCRYCGARLKRDDVGPYCPTKNCQWQFGIPAEQGGFSLKVFGITLRNNDCPPAENGDRHARHIVATKSRAAAARAFGCSDRRLKEYGAETGNRDEIVTACSEPGVVFWRPLDDQGDWTAIRSKT